jgi:hypothetical protein
VVLVYFGLMRVWNLGMNRWWYLAMFVPILNLWMGYRCFACPAGYAYHKKMDGPGILLAIIYVLMILLGVCILAVFYGAIHNPELQQQLRDALNAANKLGAKH